MTRYKDQECAKLSNYQNQLSLVSSTIRAIRMIPIQLCAVLIILALSVLTTSGTHIESAEPDQIKDPLVLDPNTLYDRTRLAASGPRAALIGKRFKRSSGSKAANQEQNLVDACQSKIEILTPYYATNSKGKLRTVVNSALMQQAIQVETCVRSPSADRSKCNAQADCGCEQKYKWHRLLVLDTGDSGSSKGLFMDWFLYPSACVCRCKASGKQFVRFIKKVNETSALPDER